MNKIYLAIPYSGYKYKSFALANEIAAKLIEKGHIVFSPISMSHPIAELGTLDGNWEVWKKIDLEFIDWCDEVVVVNFDLKAVENSVGVQEELEYARGKGKIITTYYEWAEYQSDEHS